MRRRGNKAPGLSKKPLNPSAVRYKAADGSSLTDAEADKIGKAIAAVAGDPELASVSAEDVVAAARDRKSILHKYVFDRTPEQAAEQYWLQRARYLIRSVCITYTVQGGETKVRAFPNARVTYVNESTEKEEEDRRYVFLDHAMRDKTARKYLLEQAAREIRMFQKKFRTLTELAELFKAIDKILPRLS